MISIILGRGDWIAEAVRSYGEKVFATVTNASHANKALSAGADALIVTSHEAAAHGGDVGSAVLIPVLVSRFHDSPVVAVGGGLPMVGASPRPWPWGPTLSPWGRGSPQRRNCPSPIR